MTSPSPRNPGYGAQLWTNRPQSDGTEMLFPGQAPASVLACIGHLGQFVIVSPSQKLTIVRLGQTDDQATGDPGRAALRARLASIAALFPKD